MLSHLKLDRVLQSRDEVLRQIFDRHDRPAAHGDEPREECRCELQHEVPPSDLCVPSNGPF